MEHASHMYRVHSKEMRNKFPEDTSWHSESFGFESPTLAVQMNLSTKLPNWKIWTYKRKDENTNPKNNKFWTLNK